MPLRSCIGGPSRACPLKANPRTSRLLLASGDGGISRIRNFVRLMPRSLKRLVTARARLKPKRFFAPSRKSKGVGRAGQVYTCRNHQAAAADRRPARESGEV